MQIRSAAKSDIGRVRAQNEDSYLVDDSLGLFVVADGMGGHLGGNTASRLAVETVGEVIAQRHPELTADAATPSIEKAAGPRILADAVRAACAAVYEAAQNDPQLEGMGTTVTAMLVREGRAFVAHVGDSRCYLQRGGQVVQITDDHSLVNEQIKAGLLTRDEARASRFKNIITRSVGFEREVAVDTFALPVRPADCFLLCSDGLTNVVNDAELAELMASASSVDILPATLIDLANERGGDDNITVVCVLAQAAAS